MIDLKHMQWRRELANSMGVFLIIVLIIIVMVFIGREKGRRDAEETIEVIQKVVQSKDNMGYEELIAMNDATEKEWKEWDSKYHLTIAKGQDPSLVKQKRALAAYKIKQAREEIKKRYPAVITDSEGLKKKAHLLQPFLKKKK